MICKYSETQSIREMCSKSNELRGVRMDRGTWGLRGGGGGGGGGWGRGGGGEEAGGGVRDGVGGGGGKRGWGRRDREGREGEMVGEQR